MALTEDTITDTLRFSNDAFCLDLRSWDLFPVPIRIGLWYWIDTCYTNYAISLNHYYFRARF